MPHLPAIPTSASSSFLESVACQLCRRIESPGRPAFSFLRRRWPVDLRVSSNIETFQRCQRCVFEFPRIVHPLANRLTGRRSPRFQHYSSRGGGSSGLPRVFAPPLGRRWRSRFPRISHPPVVPPMRLQVSPNPAWTAGSMMSPAFLELCILWPKPADESSRQVGPCTFPPGPQCVHDLNWAFHCRTSRLYKTELNQVPASSCQAGIAFPNQLPLAEPSVFSGLAALRVAPPS